MPRCVVLSLTISLAAVITLCAQQEAADAARRTTSSGVYSKAQAARGRDAYLMSCTDCHAADLSGNVGPGLIGDRFRRQWQAGTVRTLFDQLKRMPQNDTGAISDQTRIDLIAYLLEMNGFPAGRDELPLNPDQLERITIEGRPEDVVPNFSLVRVVGCLRRAEGSWVLAQAAEPQITQDPGLSPEADAKARATAPSGAHTFRLMQVYPSPEGYVGSRVEVKGLLIRNPDADLLNVTSVQPISPACGG
jgi:cytochrome c2